ncbi:hypothetical protein SAMN02745911_1171 [Aureimonas altamirensis DSM 21988]|uniref:HMG box protein n=2 Tax=Aureimonas altamirensis TaxID=370622 RepID=A0A0P0YX44_9HYPH|nr:HMG box protein [Aureimonas altamirensis]SHI79006.1 hypothetical protein SAMN02745911_1171 [Aureimonas altamirensis DSM 21988]
MVAGQPRILDAQRRLTTSFDPDGGKPKSGWQSKIDDCAFAIFVTDARWPGQKFDHDKKRMETVQEAFTRRWNSMPELNRQRYRDKAEACLRAAH